VTDYVRDSYPKSNLVQIRPQGASRQMREI